MGIHVASVPAGHVYVRHLVRPTAGDGVTRLPDPRPRPTSRTRSGGRRAMLERGWVDEHADEFDVMHVHFGFDAVSPERPARARRRPAPHGKPLVLTVHDLRNPHHDEPRAARRAARGPRPRPRTPSSR